ncbi:MAG: hypothetical protein AAB414_03650 [Patescibacteria group bacterium]
MSKLPGLFDIFDNLDQIPVENIARWLKPQPSLAYIENFLAQRILYPQTIPITEADLKMDLAILREALRMQGPKDKKATALLGDNPFLNTTLRKILIPSKFLNFIPDLKILTYVFVDGLLLDRKREDFFEDLWTIELSGEISEVIGSLLIPQFKDKRGILQLRIGDKNYQIHPGTLIVIPCFKDRCEAIFKLKQGKILGKEDLAVEVYGGKLGLMVDGRER